MPDRPYILMAGGGTGGHLYPGIAVAQALDALPGGCDVHVLCTTREIDAVILQPTGLAFTPQPIVPPRRTVSGLLRFWHTWRETRAQVIEMLAKRRPTAVLGLGGYAAGVAVKTAALQGVPTALLNPDVIPGQANQYLLRYSQALCCQFSATEKHVKSKHRSKLRVTGCPIRSELRSLPPREEARRRLGLDPLLRTLLVTGASQGAVTVNQAVQASVKGMSLQGWEILHLSGRDHAASVREFYREARVPARVVDFTPNMRDVFAAAELAVSRAGASTCAELTACGVPSVLMPYPFHKDMHQRANGQVLAEAGSAMLIEDRRDAEKNAEQLRPLLQSLLHDSAKREAMSRASVSLAHPDAAEQVADVLIHLAPRGR